ncbi:MAG: enoyl-CoA hydratase/isomerase family protein [Chloroflexi bacterium]|nr:enoyl-CoA hydratase/isomerase family protein [Chloroflexota bacterium]
MRRETIRLEREGPVGIVVIDRPERFNSLDPETARDLRRAGLQLARDATVRCAVLRGSHGVFCSGADLKYVREGGEADDLAYLRPEAKGVEPGYGVAFKEILEYLHATISEIRRAPKPFIAVVEGIAAAGGFGLAMSCDLVFAAEGACFEWAYARTGLTGAESTTFLLPRLLGLRRALGLAFLNPRLSAREAQDLGLVTAVFPAPAFEESWRTVAQQLAAGPTEAYGIMKRLLNEAAGMGALEDHLARELSALTRIAEGADFAEGLSAFFQKRPPEFRGEEPD